MRSRPLKFDYVGLGLTVLAMACMEILLSKGQGWDWYNDPFGRVQVLFLGFAVGVIVWESRHPAPILDLRPFRDRNFVASGATPFATYAVVYTSITTPPGLTQALFGYNAMWSGLVMPPAGFFAIPTMLFVGFLLGRGADARWLVIAGRG